MTVPTPTDDPPADQAPAHNSAGTFDLVPSQAYDSCQADKDVKDGKPRACCFAAMAEADAGKVCDGACEIGPQSAAERVAAARRIRIEAAWCPHPDPRCKCGSGSSEAAPGGAAAEEAAEPPLPVPCPHPCNGDEVRYQAQYKNQFPANFTKGLPHDPKTGLHDPSAANANVYCLLLKALATGNPQDFENVRPLGCEWRWMRDCEKHCQDRGYTAPSPPPPPPGMPPGQRQLENPQSGLAFALEGPDARSLCLPPAPAFASRVTAAEMAELYWMALSRDVPFLWYDLDADGDDELNESVSKSIGEAVADLNVDHGSSGRRFAKYLSPYYPPGKTITRRNIFRGPTQGDLKGPYVSQFLIRDVPYGSQAIPARIRTLLPDIDFLTHWDDWLAVQDGCDASQTNCDPMPRFIRSGRDLAQFVHVDRDYNAFFNACQLLLFGREPLRRCEAAPGLGVPFAPCLPYANPMAPPGEESPPPDEKASPNPFKGKSVNQLGQGTFGEQHIKSVLVGATFRAFQAVWYQKWFVHRRLRPEEFGGRVHLEALRRQGLSIGMKFPVNDLLFKSSVLERIFEYNRRQNANRRSPPYDQLKRPSKAGTYLLPMVYAEGSPLHPAYGSGHSTVAGCLATILKAFFDNDWIFPNPMEPNETGTALRSYSGRDAGDLTVAGELDKLASNIGLARVWAGVHWRSDHEEALLLGEQVAIGILCDQRNTFNEPYEFRFRSFDFGPYRGKIVRIRPGAIIAGGKCQPCVVEPIDDYRAPCERTRSPAPPPKA